MRARRQRWVRPHSPVIKMPTMHIQQVIRATGRRVCVCVLLAALFAAVPSHAGTLPKGARDVSTKHYVIKTNIKGDLVDDLARRIDAMYEEYTRRMKEFSPPKDAPKLPVYLFNTHEEYQAFTEAPNMGGLFVVQDEGTSYLAAHLEPLGRDELRRTIQHEGFHQFAYATIDDKLPLWINEGIAEYFNDAIWNGRTYLVGQVWPRRVRRLQHDIQKRQLVPFKEFTTVTSEQWFEAIKKDPEKITTYYNQAWAMVYFLGESGRDHHRRKLLDYMKKIKAGADPVAQWKKTFPNMDDLQNEFARWAVSLGPTTGATMIERQETLATMLILTKGQSFNSMGEFRNYVITRGLKVTSRAGKMRWSTSDRPAEYFESPSENLYDSSTQLFFQPAAGRPLPDIVCRAAADAHFRTRFYRDAGGEIQHEVLIE